MMLQPAIEAFASGGYENASMSDIAVRAGVSKALLYDCFPGGKAELYARALESAARTFVKELEAVSAAGDLRSREWALRELLHVVFASARREHARWRLMHNEPGTSNAAVRASARRARAKVVAALEARLQILAPEADGSERRGFYRAVAHATIELARRADRTVQPSELVEVIASVLESQASIEDARAS